MTRVLVTYASKHGSTAEIARAIADELRRQGAGADCVDVADASPASYDAVVLGSAVYNGRWMRPAQQFLKSRLPQLSAMPFWLFSSGPIGEHAARDFAEPSPWIEPRKTLDLAETAGVRGHTVFGGRVPPDPEGFAERAVAHSTPPQFADVRDWDVIRAWARDVAQELRTAP